MANLSLPAEWDSGVDSELSCLLRLCKVFTKSTGRFNLPDSSLRPSGVIQPNVLGRATPMPEDDEDRSNRKSWLRRKLRKYFIDGVLIA
jgi:hypothetical protein